MKSLVLGPISIEERHQWGQLWMEHLTLLKYWPFQYTTWVDPSYICGLAILADPAFLVNWIYVGFWKKMYFTCWNDYFPCRAVKIRQLNAGGFTPKSNKVQRFKLSWPDLAKICIKMRKFSSQISPGTPRKLESSASIWHIISAWDFVSVFKFIQVILDSLSRMILSLSNSFYPRPVLASGYCCCLWKSVCVSFWPLICVYGNHELVCAITCHLFTLVSFTLTAGRISKFGRKIHLHTVKIPIYYLITRIIHSHQSKCMIGMREFCLPRLLHGPDCFMVSILCTYLST